MTPLTSDFLVVELGDRLAAGTCGSILAELGATVVIVERKRGSKSAASKSPFRATVAAGKLSVVLDPDDSASVSLIAELIDKADAVITSSDVDGPWPAFVEAALSRCGATCDVTAFSDRAAGPAMSEGLLQAVTGTMDTTGDSESDPTFTYAPVLEISTGMYAAAGVLIARFVKKRSGHSQSVDISIFDCAISMMTTFLPRYLNGGEPKRIGNHHASMSPWNAYQVRDGWVMVCSGSNEQWKRICALLGRPELAADPKFENATARVNFNAEVDRMMEEWASQFSVEECLTRLNAVTIPCGPVSEIDQLFEDKSLLHRRMINRLHDPESNSSVFVPGALFRGSRSTGKSAERIPAAGQDRLRVESHLKTRAADAPSSPGPLPASALSGLRVIEIGQYTTAPLTARQLGAFGADVVKVEPPGGEPARSLPPLKEGQGLFFTMSNSDKRGLILDLRKEQDKQALAEMVRHADVLIENMKPGALAKFGFKPADLSRLNPRLIYCAVSGFGADSPNSSMGAMDTTIQGMSGIMDLTRSDGAPYKIGISVADIIGGQLGLTFVLAALEERDRTGQGQFIDLSMQDAAAWSIRTEWNGHKMAAPTLLKCKDGFVVCETKDEAAAVVVDVSNDTREEAVRKLGNRGLLVAPVLRLSEAINSRYGKGRDLIFKRSSPNGTEWHLLNTPLRLEKTPSRVTRAMGPLGCDTESVEADWLADVEGPKLVLSP